MTSEASDERPGWRWPLLVAAAVWIPLVVKSIRNLVKALGRPDDDTDFTILLDAARDLVERGELYYEGGAYMYPPLFAVLLVPVSLALPYLVSGILWTLVKVPLFYLALRGLLMESTEAKRLLVTLAPLLVYRSLDSDLVTGNTNVLLLAGVGLAVAAAARARDSVAGMALALVSAVKVAPAYLVLACAANGRWRLFVTAAAAGLALLLLPCLLLEGGVSGALRGFGLTNRAVLVAEDDVAGSGYLPGQSLRSIVHRHVRPIDATAHDDATVTVNLVELDATTAEWLYRSLALLLGLGGLLAVRATPIRWAIAWGCLVVLLVSPYTRKAHFVLVLPALILVLEALLASGRLTPARRRVVVVGLVLWVLLAQLTTPAIWGKPLAGLFAAHGTMGLATLAILPAMWIIRRS